MYESVALTCQIVSSLSLLANIYLAYLYFCCPVKSINFYKHFFLGTALQNLLFSTCFILLAPVLMSEDFAYVFLAYGPLREKNEGQALMVLYCLAFASSMLLATDTFIYRYFQICKPQLFESLLSRRNVVLGVLCNALILVFWLTIVRISFWPNSFLLSSMDDLILLNTGLHGDELALLGVSMKEIDAFELTLLVSLIVIMLVLAAVITYTAFKIQTTLKNAIFSSKLRQLHWQMFTLQLLQASCPFSFLHAPSFVIFTLVFGGVTSNHFITSLCSILMASFPLSSPIIIIGFLRDYRRHILVLLRVYSPSAEAPSISVHPSRRADR